MRIPWGCQFRNGIHSELTLLVPSMPRRACCCRHSSSYRCQRASTRLPSGPSRHMLISSLGLTTGASSTHCRRKSAMPSGAAQRVGGRMSSTLVGSEIHTYSSALRGASTILVVSLISGSVKGEVEGGRGGREDIPLEHALAPHEALPRARRARRARWRPAWRPRHRRAREGCAEVTPVARAPLRRPHSSIWRGVRAWREDGDAAVRQSPNGSGVVRRWAVPWSALAGPLARRGRKGILLRRRRMARRRSRRS